MPSDVTVGWHPWPAGSCSLGDGAAVALAKTWKLVVTELGSGNPLHEVFVEATNWMGALDAGRVHLGEPGGVPAGASCAVAPDGQVTLHDPVGRRTYVLMPRRQSSRPPAAGTGAVIGSGNSAGAARAGRRPSSAPPGAPDSYRPAPPAASAPKPEGPKAPSASTAKKKKARQRTIAYDASQIPKAPRTPSDLPLSKNTIGYQARPSPVASPGAVAQPVSSGGVAGVADPVPTMERPPSPRRSSAPPRARESGPDDEAAEGPYWRRFVRMDRDPTPDNPLRYRERAYAVAPGTDADDIEELLRERFADLRDRMGELPSGQFVNLAVFDHEWTHSPSRPPVATLQWKDWREVPEVAFHRPPSAPPAPAPPAPAPVPAQVQPRAGRPAGVVPSAAAPAPAPAAVADSFSGHAGANAPHVAGLPTPIPPPAFSAPTSNGGQFGSVPAAHPAPSPRPPAPDAEQPFRPRRPNTDEHDARLAHAFEAAQDLLFLQTPLEGMEFVIRLLTELIPTEAASGCLYDIDTDELRFVTVAGPGGDGRQGVAIPRRSGLMGVATTHEGLALRVDEATADPRFETAIDGRDGVAPRNALYLALSHQGRLLGVIQLLNRENRNAFTESDANLLTYVGRQAAAFLHKARIAPQARSER